MGLLSRLSSISTGKLLAFLEEAEHPETMLPQLLTELSNHQKALRQAEAKSLAAVKAAQRKLDEMQGRANRYERGAELALKKGDETTAREALREQLNIEKNLPPLLKQVQQAQQILDNVRLQSATLATQIDAIQEQGKRLNILKTQPAANTTPNPRLLDQVARMEEKTTQQELTAEAQRELLQHKPSLEERILKLEVDERLNNLKKSTKNRKTL
jgi:phage shock protein A